MFAGIFGLWALSIDVVFIKPITEKINSIEQANSKFQIYHEIFDLKSMNSQTWMIGYQTQELLRGKPNTVDSNLFEFVNSQVRFFILANKMKNLILKTKIADDVLELLPIYPLDSAKSYENLKNRAVLVYNKHLSHKTYVDSLFSTTSLKRFSFFLQKDEKENQVASIVKKTREATSELKPIVRKLNSQLTRIQENLLEVNLVSKKCYKSRLSKLRWAFGVFSILSSLLAVVGMFLERKPKTTE